MPSNGHNRRGDPAAADDRYAFSVVWHPEKSFLLIDYRAEFPPDLARWLEGVCRSWAREGIAPRPGDDGAPCEV